MAPAAAEVRLVPLVRTAGAIAFVPAGNVMVLFVNASVVALPTNVSDAFGKLIVLSAVSLLCSVVVPLDPAEPILIFPAINF